MKITIYELLGLIKDGKAPKKIKYNDEIWEYYKDLGDYIRARKPNTLFTMYYIHRILNDYVEIIEEDKKIEKLDVALLSQCDNWLICPTNEATKQDIELNPYIIDNIRENTLYFQRKINEIIDEINNLKEK